MTYDELRRIALDAVGSRAIGWVMTEPSQGGEEVAFYDHDAKQVSGMTRASIVDILRKRWPLDAAAAIGELTSKPNQRWVVAVAGEIFIWMTVSGVPVPAASGAPN